MKNKYYYQNLLRDRKHVLFLIRRDSPIMASNLRNGRSISRLSTKQLVARLKRVHAMQSERVGSYVNFLNMVGAF